jgi:hypothetical protein
MRLVFTVGAALRGGGVASAVQMTSTMETHHMRDAGAERAVNQRLLRWGFGVFAAIALFFLWQEHRAHLMGALPWLLLLACPLMHRFMHRGHRSKGGDHQGGAQAQGEPQGAKQGEHEHGGGCC